MGARMEVKSHSNVFKYYNPSEFNPKWQSQFTFTKRQSDYICNTSQRAKLIIKM